MVVLVAFIVGGGVLVVVIVVIKVVLILVLVGVGSMVVKDIMVEEEDFDKEDKSSIKVVGISCKDSNIVITGSDNLSVFFIFGLSFAV